MVALLSGHMWLVGERPDNPRKNHKQHWQGNNSCIDSPQMVVETGREHDKIRHLCRGGLRIAKQGTPVHYNGLDSGDATSATHAAR